VGEAGLYWTCTIGPLLRRGTIRVTPPEPEGTLALAWSLGVPFPRMLTMKVCGMNCRGCGTPSKIEATGVVGRLGAAGPALR
jgi:hypothetical protein